MNPGSVVRRNRIWKHKRTVIIPFDHGTYSGSVQGIEDPRKLTERIGRTRADAILISPGVLSAVAGLIGDLGVILRLDGGMTRLGEVSADYRSLTPVEHAVRIGADAGIVFTFAGTSFESESIQRLGHTAATAHEWGFPLISEVLAPSQLNNHFGTTKFTASTVAKDLSDEAMTVTRVCAEAGADIIKTRYTGSVEGFRSMIRACGVPVIVAGGPSMDASEDGLLQLAADSVAAGAGGVVFGRNVWQHPHMEQLIEAICAVVHDGESVEAARKLLA
jgi:fructose-bisphosphate aldolase / 2-amino-3,7-dideoxy-D-threo-hept-6-ulosonate synthase